MAGKSGATYHSCLQLDILATTPTAFIENNIAVLHVLFLCLCDRSYPPPPSPPPTHPRPKATQTSWIALLNRAASADTAAFASEVKTEVMDDAALLATFNALAALWTASSDDFASTVFCTGATSGFCAAKESVGGGGRLGRGGEDVKEAR